MKEKPKIINLQEEKMKRKRLKDLAEELKQKKLKDAKEVRDTNRLIRENTLILKDKYR